MRKNIFNIAIIAIIFVLSSCDKNELAVSKNNEHSDYSSTVSQNRVILAQTLIESLNENTQLASKIISECNKQFDGDKNVLCRNLFEMPISSSKNTKISSILNTNSQIQRVKSASDSNDLAGKIICQDSLLQIYYYTGTSDSTSNNFEGIVVIPEDVKERDGKDLLVIKRDGTTTYISSDIDPEHNYLVISRNERSNFDKTQEYNNIGLSKTKSNTAANGKKMKITRATFTSIDSKRQFESWWGGEPEVRLNVIYAYHDSRTNSFKELRNSTFMYPGSWIKVKTFKKNQVKWNNSVVECPYWYEYEAYYGRRLIWTEEDGDTSETEKSQTHEDPLTHIKTEIKVKVPASDNDVLICDSWIDFNSTQSGEQQWGAIKFDLSFE